MKQPLPRPLPVFLVALEIIVGPLGFAQKTTARPRSPQRRVAGVNSDEAQLRSELADVRQSLADLREQVKDLTATRDRPPSPFWPDQLKDYATIVTPFVTLFGFLFVLKQIRNTTYGALYSQQNSIHQFFVLNPDLRPYFYANKAAPAAPTEDLTYEKVRATTEMMADFIEHIYLQKGNLPRNIWPGWECYMRELYSRSSLLQAHFMEKRKWYGEKFVSVFPQTAPTPPNPPANKTT